MKAKIIWMLSLAHLGHSRRCHACDCHFFFLTNNFIFQQIQFHGIRCNWFFIIFFFIFRPVCFNSGFLFHYHHPFVSLAQYFGTIPPEHEMNMIFSIESTVKWNKCLFLFLSNRVRSSPMYSSTVRGRLLLTVLHGCHFLQSRHRNPHTIPLVFIGHALLGTGNDIVDSITRENDIFSDRLPRITVDTDFSDGLISR